MRYTTPIIIALALSYSNCEARKLRSSARRLDANYQGLVDLMNDHFGSENCQTLETTDQTTYECQSSTQKAYLVSSGATHRVPERLRVCDKPKYADMPWHCQIVQFYPGEEESEAIQAAMEALNGPLGNRLLGDDSEDTRVTSGYYYVLDQLNQQYSNNCRVQVTGGIGEQIPFTTVVCADEGGTAELKASGVRDPKLERLTICGLGDEDAKSCETYLF